MARGAVEVAEAAEVKARARVEIEEAVKARAEVDSKADAVWAPAASVYARIAGTESPIKEVCPV